MKLVLWGCCVLVSAFKAANCVLGALVLQGVLMLGVGVFECPGNPCVERRLGQLVTMAIAFQSVSLLFCYQTQQGLTSPEAILLTAWALHAGPRTLPPRYLLASAVEPSWVACAQGFLGFWAWKLHQGCCWEGGSGPELLACSFTVLVGTQEFRGLVGLGRARTHVGTKQSKRR